MKENNKNREFAINHRSGKISMLLVELDIELMTTNQQDYLNAIFEKKEYPELSIRFDEKGAYIKTLDGNMALGPLVNRDTMIQDFRPLIFLRKIDLQ